MNLEHELRRALTRKDPPDGFEEKVLTRASAHPPSRFALRRTSPSHLRGLRWRRRKWLALPLAASLIAAVAWDRHRDVQLERQAEAERTAYEATLALHIAGEKLAAVQRKLQGVNHQGVNNQ
jgi:hypothetical protein